MVGPTPDPVKIRQRLREGVDFASLLSVAADHSVRPLLIRALAAASWDGVPPSVRSDLQAFQRVHGGFCLAATHQLARIVDRLAARQVKVAAFKGPTLAISLYGDLAAREYNDIDLIVPVAQRDEAEDVLISLGYRGAQGDRHFRRAFLAHQRQYMFAHANQVTVDLHWAFTGSRLPFPLSLDDLWTALENVPIGERSVPAVAGCHLALLLAGHGAKEGWQSLGWVCDFALLINRWRHLDWPALHRRARDQGCGDSVLLACAMANHLLGVAVPTGLSPALLHRRRVRDLAAALAADLKRGLPAPGRRGDLADLDLCDRRIDRMKAAARLALTPTAGDHAALPLPRALWPVYRFTRPFRLVAKAVARL